MSAHRKLALYILKTALDDALKGDEEARDFLLEEARNAVGEYLETQAVSQ